MENSKKILEIDKLIEEYAKSNPEFWDKVKDKRVKDFSQEELLEFINFTIGFKDVLKAKKQ